MYEKILVAWLGLDLAVVVDYVRGSGLLVGCIGCGIVGTDGTVDLGRLLLLFRGLFWTIPLTLLLASALHLSRFWVRCLNLLDPLSRTWRVL